jgi:hypothetical protein
VLTPELAHVLALRRGGGPETAVGAVAAIRFEHRGLALCEIAEKVFSQRVGLLGEMGGLLPCCLATTAEQLERILDLHLGNNSMTCSICFVYALLATVNYATAVKTTSVITEVLV